MPFARGMAIGNELGERRRALAERDDFAVGHGTPREQPDSSPMWREPGPPNSARARNSVSESVSVHKSDRR
jgi:hypothetical protein